MTAILSLALISGPEQVRLETRVVDGYEFTLGRGQDADWSLFDPETNILSRRHCLFSQEDGDWWLLDLSGNGTFLNHEQQPIGGGGKRRLRDGDRIRLGAYEFQAQLGGSVSAEPSLRAEPWPLLRDTMDGPMGARPPTGDQGATGRGRGGGSGFANPFADDEEEPVTPARLAPGVSPPVGRSGNPFADMRDDTADDGWPPAGPAEPPPAPAKPRPAAPLAAPPALDAPALDALAMELPALQAQGANPFAEPGDVEAAAEPFAPMVSVADTLPPEELQVSSVPPGAESHAAASGANPLAAPASPVAARPSAALPTVQDDILLRALLQGAGLPDSAPRDPEQTLRALGAAFRAMVTGLREVQRARRTVRGGFRIAQTAWTENPLKLAVDEDDALEALLGAGRRSAMPPARAVEEVLKEIVLHEVATVAAMQEAVRTLLASLAPDKLREIAEQGAGLTVLPAQRKARAWDTYEATHARVTAALQDDFDSVFGRAFARAYERVMAEQKE